MASETLQETPSQQTALGSNGDSSNVIAHMSLSPESPHGNNSKSGSNGGASLSAVLGGDSDDEQQHATPRGPLFADTAGANSDDDVDSEPVTSPASITSPPYWVQVHPRGPTHHSAAAGGRHNRAVSNVSVESVPDAITLQDNERDDDGDDDVRGSSRSGNTAYGRDRNRACWAKSVHITDSVLVNGSATNIGAFVVWNIRVETLNGSYMNIRKRYSEFDDLRRRLVQTFPGFEAAVPVLPPKSVISKFRSKFLEKRRAGLQYFLNCILLNPEFSGSPVLKEFLFA